jgi:hypothetical protein
MDASVRYILHNQGATNRAEDDGGFKPSLCFRADKFAHCVVNEEDGIRVVKIPVRDFDHSPVVQRGPDVYPTKRCAQLFLSYTERAVARRSITVKAKRLLEGVLGGGISVEAVEAPEVEDLTTGGDQQATKAPKSPAGSATTLVGAICAELGLDPPVARRQLRKAGLHAPYTDEKLIRSILTTTK